MNNNLLVSGALLALAGSVTAQKVDFERQVLPILQESCYQCHAAPYRDGRGMLRKPKGDLRLDGKGWILHGVQGEPVLVVGQPDKSSLYTRTTLDKDDDDLMPAEGDALTKNQQRLLARWISQGAQFGDWVGSGGPGLAKPTTNFRTPHMKVLETLGKGLKPAYETVLQKAGGQRCRIEAVMPGMPLLRAHYLNEPGKIGDAQFASLESVSGHLTELLAGKTNISDASLELVGRMRRLTKLDLRQTAVGDEGLRHLAGLTELRSLNLFGTKVGDGSIDTLGRLKNLRRIYLWKSQVTPDGVARLRELLPNTRISHALTLPEVPAQSDRRRGRGRRRAPGKKPGQPGKKPTDPKRRKKRRRGIK